MQEDAVSALTEIAGEIQKWQDNFFTHSIWYTLIVAAIAGIVAFIVLRTLKGIYKRRAQGNLKFFYRLINLVVIIVAVLVVLMTITPLANMSRTLLAGSGLLAVVIGIAAQAALGNVFSGLSIGISRPFVIGETIEVVGQDITGVVTEISLRQTVIRDLNNKHVVIPNSVIDKEIIRTVRGGQNAVMSYLQVGVGYGSDLQQAIGIIKRAVLAHKDFYDIRTKQQLQDGAAQDVLVAVTELGESAVVLRASVWAKDAGTGFVMLSDLRQEILRQFKQAGIEIPYAYRNVIIQNREDA